MVLRYILAWPGMVVLAILNAAARQTGYGRWMNELRAHQTSSVTGIILFGAYVWALSRFWPIRSGREALLIGLIWLVLTVTFEFVFGHYAMKHPWSKLLADYNVLRGRLWVLVLVWVTIAPLVFFWLG